MSIFIKSNHKWNNYNDSLNTKFTFFVIRNSNLQSIKKIIIFIYCCIIKFEYAFNSWNCLTNVQLLKLKKNLKTN